MSKRQSPSGNILTTLHNGSGGGVIPDIPDEFFRRIIPTACDTLLFEEDALLFGQVLHYEKDKPHFKARAQYNGNVSSIVWQILWGERQAYGFQYDQMNRLLQAHYAVYKPDLSISTDNRFGVKVDGYDRDGNIRKVIRRGVVGECEDGFEYGEIDHLNYTYSNGRLNAVSEGSDAERGYSYSGGGFSYDANGNVTAMGDRGVTIEYDHHFMPKVIRMGTVERIEFNYAGTRKLSSRYYDGNGDLKESFMYYGRGIIRNDAFYAVECPDARIVLDEEDNKYKVQHHIKDYLGHIRLTVWDRDEDGDLEMEEILYSSDYYPFGMRIDNYFSRMPEEEENYMRRGISGNEEEPRVKLYDFHARWYDPGLGRFTGVDPLAEKYYSISSYAYVANNPLIFIDPDGREIIISHKGQSLKYQNGQLYNSDGSEYSGKVRGFLKSTVRSLDQIRNTEIGQSMIGELQSSKNTFTIQHYSVNPDKRNEFKPLSVGAAYAFQLLSDPTATGTFRANLGGSGGNIFWNPAGTDLPTTDGISSSATTDLGHELFHALDANRGELNSSELNGVRIDEFRTVNRENTLRGELKLPFRTHYQVARDPSGKALYGTGPNMIDLTIKPYWNEK